MNPSRDLSGDEDRSSRCDVADSLDRENPTKGRKKDRGREGRKGERRAKPGGRAIKFADRRALLSLSLSLFPLCVCAFFVVLVVFRCFRFSFFFLSFFSTHLNIYTGHLHKTRTHACDV